MMIPERGDTLGGRRSGGRFDGDAGSTRAFRLAASLALLAAMHAAAPSLLDVMRWDKGPMFGVAGRCPEILAMHAAGPRLALAASVVLATRMRSAVALTAVAAVLALVEALDAAACAVTYGIAWAAVPAAMAALQVGVLARLDMDAAGRAPVRGMGRDRA